MQKYNLQCRVKLKRAKKMAGESKLYLSTILDLYNNEVIAYQISDAQNAQLVLDTLELVFRKCNTAGTILHSD
ncbi:DDE-type integrase/transposase/recombinase [Planococcus halocryophilus]|uniref:DDE-type integrase/transposase/recombinase n=1 Tax=Planococcus halocryophilus TaxID=1215089 RepID=UPI003D328C03